MACEHTARHHHESGSSGGWSNETGGIEVSYARRCAAKVFSMRFSPRRGFWAAIANRDTGISLNEIFEIQR
jgi:hypothetical protein